MIRRVLLCLTVAVATVCTASADIDLNQYIKNSGFESPTNFTDSCSPAPCVPTQFWNYAPPDWTVVGIGGVYRSLAGTSSDPSQFDPPNGPNLVNNSAFINPYNGQNIGWLEPGSYMYQMLDLSLIADTTYTIDFKVGRRLEQGPSNYQITVTAVAFGGPYIDGVNTWRFYGNTSSITPGTWKDEFHSFSGSGIAVGQPLTVWLGAEGAPGDPLGLSGTGQVNFDSAPEPATMILLSSAIVLLGVLEAVRKATRPAGMR